MVMPMNEVLERAKKRYQIAKDAWQHIYEAAKEDLHFLSDEPNCQWDDKDVTERRQARRVTLQIDQLGQFIHQVTNDIRMNTPTIKVLPVGDGADVESAEMVQGRIKAIEYKSNADAAYDLGADFAVKASIGFITVDHDYVDDNSFEQELKIQRVVNPFSILLDPDSTEPDGSDAKYGFICREMSKAEFERDYPDASPVSFGEAGTDKKYKEDDNILTVEYFEVEESEKHVGQLDKGDIETVKEGVEYKSTRKIKERKIGRYKLSGNDVLYESTFPGKYIPIVPVYGEEAWKDGKRHLHSLIRKSKSAQKMFNLWKSLETELLLKQPIAPVQAAVGQMRGFEEDWKQPDKAMVLYYHQTDVEGQQAPAPQRLAPPTIPTGIVNAARETIEDIKASMGLYNTSLGAKSNETSGIAIERRDKQGDVATFHFGDNLVRSITHVGKIIVCALPEIEDTPRIVQVVGQEEENKLVGINGAMADDQERPFYMNKGKYDVRVVTGASFTTQRQEASAMYSELIRAMPDMMPVIGDLVFKYQDMPGAQAIAHRMKKVIDPKFLDEKDRQEGLNPEVEAMKLELQQVVAQAQQQIQALQAELENKNAETEVKMQELELRKSEIEEQAAIKRAELEIKKADLNIKFMQATQSKEKPESEPQEMGSPDDSIEVLNARIQEKLMKQQMEQEQALIDQQAEMMQAEQEAMRERQELGLKMADIQAREQQAQMLIAALQNISGQVAQLTASVSQPITIQRDEQGNLIGAL
jgi:hypothetical protein